LDGAIESTAPNSSGLWMKRDFAEDETGSISILIIGLFLLTVALLFLITDVATVAVAKRSLVQATEAATLRGAQSLDLASYYNGNSGVAIPLDCNVARGKVFDEIQSWASTSGVMRRPEIVDVAVEEFACFDNYIHISVSARALLPFSLPQSSLVDIEIYASAGAASERSTR